MNKLLTFHFNFYNGLLNFQINVSDFINNTTLTTEHYIIIPLYSLCYFNCPNIGTYYYNNVKKTLKIFTIA